MEVVVWERSGYKQIECSKEPEVEFVMPKSRLSPQRVKRAEQFLALTRSFVSNQSNDTHYITKDSSIVPSRCAGIN